MADETLKLRLDSFEKILRDIQKRLDRAESELESKVSAGALQGLSNKIDNEVEGLEVAMNRVEAKVQNVLSPDETIALIGLDDLRAMKRSIRQMLTIKQEQDQTHKTIIDLLMAYDAGQAKTLNL